MALFGRRSDSSTTAEKLARAEAPSAPPSESAAAPGRSGTGETFLPRRRTRRGVESFLVRVIATGGIVAVGTALAAILGTQDVDPWVIGLTTSLVSVVLAAVLWSSRTL